MGVNSANPDELDGYARAAGDLNEYLRQRAKALIEQYNAYSAKPSDFRVDASGPLAGLVRFVTRNAEDDRWVEVVAAAFRAAGAGGGLPSLTDDQLGAVLRANGVSVGPRESLTVNDPVLNGLPPTSGYAIDPVCTATGHFVETEIDLDMPVRVSTLRWVRTYNSRHIETGPFGRGWSSWASARVTRARDGVMLTQPDGKRAYFESTGEGGFQRVAGILGELTEEDGGWALRWFGGDQWLFGESGRLTHVEAGSAGTTTLEWNGAQLEAMVHSGGRRLDLSWDANRIVAVRASDGREATYDYDEQGDLVGTSSPGGGPRRYDLNERGLLASVVDADGVELLRNEYDLEGRVLSQRSPFGRMTRFEYGADGATVVHDDSGGPQTVYFHDQAGRLVGLVDDDGNRMTKVYDEWGNPVAVTDRRGATVVQEYDERSRLLRRVEPDGATRSYEWDDLDRLVAHTDPLGAVVRLAYEGDDREASLVVDPLGAETRLGVEKGLIARIIDPDGVETTFERDADGLVVTGTDGLGATTRFLHGPAGELTEIESPLGAVTRMELDAQGRVSRQVQADGSAITYEWTAAGRLAAVTDPLGARAETRFGPHGHAVELVDAVGSTTRLEWDQLGNLSGLVNPEGAEIRYDYDGLCRLRSLVDPTGGAWLRDYDPEGNLVALTDPVGNRQSRRIDEVGRTTEEDDGAGGVTRYVYDLAGRVVRTTDPSGAVSTIDYDLVGRPVAFTDANGGTTRYAYSPAGRVVSIASPLGHRTTYEYDRAGRVVAEVDPNGGRRLLERDAEGRVTRTVSPSGLAAEFGYDDLDREVEVRDPSGGVTRFGHDAVGRMTQVADPTGAVSRFAHDHAGQLIEAVDPLGAATRFDYSPGGFLARAVDPAGGQQLYEYDAAGRMLAFTDQLGTRTTMQLDPAGRLLSRTDGSGGEVRFWRDGAARVTGWGSAQEPEVLLELDPVGRVVRAAEPQRTTTFEWDGLGHLVGQEVDGQALVWRYDADGRRSALTYPNGEATSYSYDSASRLIGLDHPSVGGVRIERDADGRPVMLEGNGLSRHWEYEAGRLVTLQERRDGITAAVRYEHDPAGRVVAQTTESSERRFAFDAAGQLSEMVGPDGHWSWSYDGSGCRVAERSPGGDRVFGYDAAHQLTSIDGIGGRVDLAYDGAGRRVSESRPGGGEVTYQWDNLGRLTEVVRRGDGDGRSTSMEVDAFGHLLGVGSLRTMWDPSAGVSDLRRIGDQDVVGDYQPLALASADGVGWLSVSELARSTGDPWTGGFNQAAGVHLGQRGELNIDGLVWMRNRVYDPMTGSFLSRDPLPGVLGTAAATNPYDFANNDPVDFFDPLGLRPLTDAEYRKMRDAENRPIWDRAAHALGDAWDATGGKVVSFVKDHADAIAAGALVVAGGLMVATGVGAPIGLGILVGTGLSAGTQLATTGHINARQVWVSGLVGAVTGATASAGASLATQVAVGAATGAGTSIASQAILNHGHVDFGQVLFDGAIGGAIPVGGKLASAALGRVAAKFGSGVAAREVESSLTRVGRWMSAGEHQAMEDTGMVQPGRVSPQVSVAHPADVNAYMRQAAPESRYIEFDVPENSLVAGGKEGWATIPGPESIHSRLAIQRGLPPYSYPPAVNIEWLASKLAP